MTFFHPQEECRDGKVCSGLGSRVSKEALRAMLALGRVGVKGFLALIEILTLRGVPKEGDPNIVFIMGTPKRVMPNFGKPYPV